MVLNISWVTYYLPGWIKNNTSLAAKKWVWEEGTNVNGDVTDGASSRNQHMNSGTTKRRERNKSQMIQHKLQLNYKIPEPEIWRVDKSNLSYTNGML
jgi:hypothetical protein